MDAGDGGQKAAHLFGVRPATRWRTDSAMTRFLKSFGENPAAGRVVPLLAGPEAEGARSCIEILDASGALVRRLSSKKRDDAEEEAEDDPDGGADKPPLLPTGAGVQRFVWDLHL